jgi:hypothetical protein
MKYLEMIKNVSFLKSRGFMKKKYSEIPKD